MSLLNAEDEANTWKASDPSESNDDIDDLFGIPPCLVSEGAKLSQYRDESLSQTSKHAMAMEQPIPAAWIDPAGDTTLAHGGSLQSLQSRQASTPTLTTLVLPNMALSQPFITAACSNDATGQHTGYPV